MRRSRPPRGPVQGKTGENEKRVLKKRVPLAEIRLEELAQSAESEEAALKKPRKSLSEKKAQAKSSAVFMLEASPISIKAVKSALEKDPILSSVLTPSRVNVGERSPGGAPKWVLTKTPRARILDRSNDFSVLRVSKDGEKKAMRSLFFEERLKNNFAQESIALPQDVASQSLLQRSFGPVSLGRKDLENIPPRHRLKKEKTVLGVSANKGAEQLFPERPTEFHGSHGIAVALAAGKMDTQVKDNLFIGTNRANWTKAHYERECRRLLLDDPKRSLELSGTADLIGQTQVAKAERLNYDFCGANETHLKGTLHFDTLRLKTESVLPSKVFGKMIETLLDEEEDARPRPGLKK